jgi:hypothetical protein
MCSRLDVQAEPELEVQKEQVPEMFECPQATSYVDTNIAVEQAMPQCIPPIILGFSFNHYLFAMLDCALIKFIGIVLVP